MGASSPSRSGATLPMANEQSIFDAARRIEALDVRHRYVEQACGEDLALRERVEALLRVHEENPTFLLSPIIPPPHHLDAPAVETPGTVLGPYKLVRQIG